MSTFYPWKILHLDLFEGVPALSLEPNCQGFYIVFWWHNIPLGHLEIPSAQLPMSASQLANLALKTITPAVSAHLLEQGLKVSLPEELSENPSGNTSGWCQSLDILEQSWSKPLPESVSVVICTRDRPEQLAQCLRSLQSLSPPPYEIVVVDNAPKSDQSRQVVTQMPGIRYVPEPRPGLSVARNTGIRHSTGDIIAFTDDDLMVHPQWLTRLQQGFRDSKVMFVTGLVLVGELETEAQFIFEKYWSFNKGYTPLTFDECYFQEQKRWGVPVWHLGAGANMAFRRQAFELVGDFDERLGAGASGCSEDSELWYRLLAEGWHCRYEPTSVVYHYHRRHLDKLESQLYYYMRGHVAALLIQFAKYKHWGNLLHLFVTLPRYYAKLFLRGLKNRFKHRYSTLQSEILGCFSGVKFYLQNRSYSKLLPSSSELEKV